VGGLYSGGDATWCLCWAGYLVSEKKACLSRLRSGPVRPLFYLETKRLHSDRPGLKPDNSGLGSPIFFLLSLERLSPSKRTLTSKPPDHVGTSTNR
jgi:hypothetical protein